MDEQRSALEINATSIIKVIVFVLIILFLNKIQDVLIAVFVAIMISSAVNPLADWLQKYKIPRIVGVISLYVIFFVATVLILSLGVPLILSEITQLIKILPDLVTGFSTALQSAQESNKYFLFLSEIENSLNSINNFFDISDKSIFDIIVNAFGGLLSFVAAIVISFYLSIIPGGIVNFIRALIPSQYEQYVIYLWKKSERKIGMWFQGQLLLALIVGMLVFVGLSILNIKYALILAIIAMVLELVPIAGPIISSIPAIFLAFAQSPILVVWVLVLYAGIQFIEANVLTPVIMGKSTGLNPIIVIIALLIGGTLKGILGILIAVPLAVVIVEILEDLSEEREKKKIVLQKEKGMPT